MPSNTYLSSNVTINKYRFFEKARDVPSIVKFVKERFTERYITPMRVVKEKKHGFTIMAVSCLMIEALESFYKGWADSTNKSEKAFCDFFDRNNNFSFIRKYGKDFYRGVRCGILHQAESTDGWHIRRKGPIFEPTTKTVNAKLFHDEIEKSLKNYCTDLQSADWDGDIWKKFREKMKAVCKNCEA